MYTGVVSNAIRVMHPKITGHMRLFTVEQFCHNIIGTMEGFPDLRVASMRAETALSKAMRLTYTHPSSVCGVWERRQAHAVLMVALYR
jgi:hypothetical protein